MQEIDVVQSPSLTGVALTSIFIHSVGFFGWSRPLLFDCDGSSARKDKRIPPSYCIHDFFLTIRNIEMCVLDCVIQGLVRVPLFYYTIPPFLYLIRV